MELKKHIIDEKTGISYTLCGDYFLDDFELRLIIRAPEECRNINKVKGPVKIYAQNCLQAPAE